MTYRVLLVCMGNICRSPTAEGVLRCLIKNNNLNSIHIFKSRKDAFKESDVLQENVIFKIVKDLKQSNICVSSSNGVGDLNESEINNYDSDLLLDSTSSESFIRIPESQEDAEVAHSVTPDSNHGDTEARRKTCSENQELTLRVSVSPW